MDVIEVAFPKATSQIVHTMAYNYLQDAHQKRVARQIAGKKTTIRGEQRIMKFLGWDISTASLTSPIHMF